MAILNLELDDSRDKKFLRPRIRLIIKNQKFQNRRASPCFEITEWDSEKWILFRIFKRLHASNKYGGGTGAGLTIAKKIVSVMVANLG